MRSTICTTSPRTLLDAAEDAARALIAASADLMPVIVAGCPVRADGQLFNCALVIHRGRLVLGVVPKSYLPPINREFYEKRWFAPAAGAISEYRCVLPVRTRRSAPG